MDYFSKAGSNKNVEKWRSLNKFILANPKSSQEKRVFERVLWESGYSQTNYSQS